MAKEQTLIFEATIVECNKGGNMLVQLTDTKNIIKARIAGKMRKNYIKLVIGDKVLISLSPYDLTQGLIVKRF